MTRRNLGEIVKICILAKLNLTFQAHVTKPCLLLIMEPEPEYSAVRGYHVYQTVWDTEVGETPPCNNSDRFAVAKS